MPPLAKRVEERRRRNAVPGETVATMTGEVVIPKLPARLNKVAVDWYNSLAISGQTQFFEPSDWAAAVYTAKCMSAAVAPGAPASLMASVWQMVNDLLATEQSRRRAKLQVNRVLEGEPETGKPTALQEYRKALGQ